MPEKDTSTSPTQPEKPPAPTLSDVCDALAQDIVDMIESGEDAAAIHTEVLAYATLVQLRMEGAR